MGGWVRAWVWGGQWREHLRAAQQLAPPPPPCLHPQTPSLPFNSRPPRPIPPHPPHHAHPHRQRKSNAPDVSRDVLPAEAAGLLEVHHNEVVLHALHSAAQCAQHARSAHIGGTWHGAQHPAAGRLRPAYPLPQRRWPRNYCPKRRPHNPPPPPHPFFRAKTPPGLPPQPATPSDTQKALIRKFFKKTQAAPGSPPPAAPAAARPCCPRLRQSACPCCRPWCVPCCLPG